MQMQQMQPMQQDINELRRMHLFHPKVKEVVNYIMSIQGYNRMPLDNLDALFRSEMNKRFNPYYQYDQYYNQTINEILKMIHTNNAFGLPQGSYNNFNPNNDNNFQGSNFDSQVHNNLQGSIFNSQVQNNNNFPGSNFNSQVQNNNNFPGSNFNSQIQNNNNNNFHLYDENNIPQNQNNINNNFGIYDENNNKQRQISEGNFGIYDENDIRQNQNDNNFNQNKEQSFVKQNSKDQGNFKEYIQKDNNNSINSNSMMLNNSSQNNQGLTSGLSNSYPNIKGGNFSMYNNSFDNFPNNQQMGNFQVFPNNNPLGMGINNNNIINNNQNNFNQNNSLNASSNNSQLENQNNNNNQGMDLIFLDEYGTKIKLNFSPNDTIEKAFKDYMNRFNFSYNSGIDFFYHGNKIDKFSNVKIGIMFHNNSTIEVKQ